jgi:hypothetical protein
MKPKHIGLTLILMSLLTVGLGCWWQVAAVTGKHPTPPWSPAGPISNFTVPDAAELEKMDRLERAMAVLGAPLPQRPKQVDLSALGYVPVNLDGAGGGPSAGPSTIATYQVTMAFNGRHRRFCVIDGNLHTEGDLMPDGAAIVRIESKRVLISKNSHQRWLSVDPMFKPPKTEET